MTNIITTSDYTITDFNDAISLSGYIGSNQAHTQIYNPDNGQYTPNWTTTNLILTPQLFVTSTTSDVIATSAVTSVKWYKDSETSENAISTAGSYTLSGTKNHILTVKSNVLAGILTIKYICVIGYHDSTTDLDLTYKMDISFSRVSSGSGIADAVAMCPNGNVFKNGSIASLIATCDLWRGSIVDTSSVSYQWYVMDGSVATSQGGGIGWKRLVNAENLYAGVTTRQLTVYASSVLSVAVYKCVVKDTDSTSNSYNQEFYDTVTFTDLSDPVQAIIVSTGGDTFKNGNGSTQLTCRLFQAGVEIDSSGTMYTYKWYKYNKSSTLITDFGGTGINFKTGKSLSVGSSDVDEKATFRCEVEN